MSYHIYTTEAIILSDSPRREADKVYSILTQDLGLIRASAGGVRKEVSKLRTALEPLSISKVSLVKGKEYWRLTSASLEASLPEALRDNKEVLKAFARALALVEKLVAGEHAEPELFNTIRSVIEFALHDKEVQADPKIIEALLVVRSLYELGYISGDEVSEVILRGSLENAVINMKENGLNSAIKAINKGIHSSDLTN